MIALSSRKSKSNIELERLKSHIFLCDTADAVQHGVRIRQSTRGSYEQAAVDAAFSFLGPCPASGTFSGEGL